MKKLISILFILAMLGTLLPGVLAFEKKVVLFSTVEEEQPDHAKDLKLKNEVKSILAFELSAFLYCCLHTAYPNMFILFSDDPCIGNHTPPPDSFC